MLAALVVSEAVAGADEIPPAPVDHIQAVDQPGDRGGHMLISWTLSPDDRIVFSGLGPDGYVITSGQGTVYRRRGIHGYRIYRRREGGALELIAEVPAGVDHFVDAGVENNVLYFYEVRTFDAAFESLPRIEPGSGADAARSARAVDNTLQPVDASGQPVLGWFDPGDDTVGFNDFFLFADHFGFVEGEAGFDALFDLNGDFRIDFDDFFLFADHFGRVVANFRKIGGGAGG